MKQEPQKTEEKIDIAIANLLFSNLSLEKIEKIPKWLLENIEKNKPQFKQTLHSYTAQREQAVREEWSKKIRDIFFDNCDYYNDGTHYCCGYEKACEDISKALTLNDTDRV